MLPASSDSVVYASEGNLIQSFIQSSLCNIVLIIAPIQRIRSRQWRKAVTKLKSILSITSSAFMLKHYEVKISGVS